MRKRRYLYVLLFAAPTFLLALIAGAMLLGASAGVLWLFVFGDDPWPSEADTLLTGVFVLGTAAFWIAQLSVAYAVGKREETKRISEQDARADIRRRHGDACGPHRPANIWRGIWRPSRQPRLRGPLPGRWRDRQRHAAARFR